MHRTQCGQLFVVFILIALCSTLASAVTVNPVSQQLTKPADQAYTYVYSIINNDPQPRSLHLIVDPYSAYLEDKLTFSKKQFSLLPSQTENIQLTINPQGLGPETHSLKIGVYDGETKLSSFELLITVPGTAIEKYTAEVSATDTSTKSVVPVTVKLTNFGNIIGNAQITLVIKHNGEIAGTVKYPELVQILPGKSATYDLVYTDTLDPGFYTAELTASFANLNVNASDQFNVQVQDTREQVKEGSDLVISFASLGGPSAVKYSFRDSAHSELAAGTFLPQSGDLVIPTSKYTVGTYDLYLTMQNNQQHITVVIEREVSYMQYGLILIVLAILGYAAYTFLPDFHLRWRMHKLERAVQDRQEEVTKLINRSHRLVDRYTTLHARRHQTDRYAGASDQRS